MNSEAAFLQAALPEPKILLHQRLEPYSIGHEMILRRINSPFLGQSEFEDEHLVSKLFTAVFVCCHQYNEASSGLASKDLPETFKAWRKTCGKFNEKEIAVSLIDWIRFSSRGPDISRVPGRGSVSPPGAPFLILMLQLLQGSLGFSRSEALNCPFGLARWHYCTWHEQHGNVRIISNMDGLREAAKRMGMQPMQVEFN